MRIRKRRNQPPPLEPVAGNGLLDRRALLGRGIVLAGAMTTAVGTSPTSVIHESPRRRIMVCVAPLEVCIGRRWRSASNGSMNTET